MIEGRNTEDSVAPSPQRPVLGRWLAAISAGLIGIATLTPSTQMLEPGIDPFCIVCGSVGGVDVVLNLLLFLPLGVGLALALVGPWRALMGMAAFTLAIECLQILVVPGRDASLGDVLMNIIGGALGYAVGARVASLLTPSTALARTLAVVWGALWLGMQAVSSYSLTPRPPDATYFGQIAPTLGGGGLSPFEGQVLGASIDTSPILDGELSEGQSIRVRDALQVGAFVRAEAVSRGSPPLIAPIFRVADDEQREVLMVAQKTAALIFGVRTGADVLKLTPVRFRLHDVFPSASGPLARADTIIIEARHARGYASLRSRSHSSGSRELTLALHASEGWRLFLPLQTYVEGGSWSVLLSSAWIILLIFPLGYWISFVSERQDPVGSRRVEGAAVVLFVVVLAVGLVGIPIAFGLDSGDAWEWVVTAAGALLGATFSLVFGGRRWRRSRPGR